MRTTDIEGSTYVPALTDPSRLDDQAIGQLLSDGPTVRRLSPTECERLMSWPDNWTAIDGENTPDSRRYAACGDGVVSNVAEWLGRGLLREEAA